MPAYVRGGTLAPILHHRLFRVAFVQEADVQCVVAQLMPHPAVAKADVHVQHRHDAVHHPFASIVQEAKTRIGNKP